jgi:hypothetical protein
VAETCRVCGRKRVEGSDYCVYHHGAHEGLKEAHEGWRRALGVGWAEFLDQVLKRPETGDWAREVAEHLRNQYR